MKSLPILATLLAISISAGATQSETLSLPNSKSRTFGVHLASWHSTPRQGNGETWNNTNPGFFFRLDNTITAGAYYNSTRRPTFYVAYTADLLDSDNFAVSLAVGGGTGYRYAITPIVSPSVLFKPLGLRLHYLPGIGGPHVLHLSLEKKF